MSFLFDIVFLVFSLIFCYGRVYELTNYYVAETGFLGYTSVVSNYIVIGLCVIIALLVSILSINEKTTLSKKVVPVGVIGCICAVMIAIGNILGCISAIQNDSSFMLYIIGVISAVSGIIISITDIRGKLYELPIFILLLSYPVVKCVYIIAMSTNSLQDTDYLYSGIASIASVIFLLLRYKTVFNPQKNTLLLLHFSSLLSFLFVGVTSLANIILSLISHNIILRNAITNVGYILFGVYSLSIAFYTLKQPTSVKNKNSTKTEDYKLIVDKKDKIKTASSDKMIQNNYSDKSDAVRDLFFGKTDKNMTSSDIVTINENYKESENSLNKKVYNPNKSTTTYSKQNEPATKKIYKAKH